MNEITLKSTDVEAVKAYIESGDLVHSMNCYGLSFSSIAFVLTELSNSCDRVLLEMMGKGEIDAD